MRGEIGEVLREAVVTRACHVCEYCLIHEDDAYHGCEVDHVISVKHDGATELENLAYACFQCNRHKGTDIGSRGSTGDFIRFFNPRADRWSDHSRLQSGRIEGESEIGAVTGRILDFNHPERVLLRRVLADIGRYPSIEALARMRD